MPASGFYEWQAQAEGKQPMYITLKDSPVMAIAGLWESWREPNSDEEMRTFTILTTGANTFMRSIHDRMPVLLHADDYPVWLDADEVPQAVLMGLMERDFESAALKVVPVSKAVNKPTVDSPELIEPLSA